MESGSDDEESLDESNPDFTLEAGNQTLDRMVESLEQRVSKPPSKQKKLPIVREENLESMAEKMNGFDDLMNNAQTPES